MVEHGQRLASGPVLTISMPHQNPWVLVTMSIAMTRQWMCL
jgi:hypothetical protein